MYVRSTVYIHSHTNNDKIRNAFVASSSNRRLALIFIDSNNQDGPPANIIASELGSQR